MSKSEYYEKLKDPRWQKKRLDILNRDGFACRGCGDKESTLHVHHIVYLRGLEPWDIPDGFLITLCESCHKPSCKNGPCTSCSDYMADCEGQANIPEDMVSAIGSVLDIIWKGEGDFLDVLSNAHMIIGERRPYASITNS